MFAMKTLWMAGLAAATLGVAGVKAAKADTRVSIGFSTPVVVAAPAYRPAPVVVTPVYSSPVYSSPVYSTPVYSSPVYSSPAYCPPVYVPSPVCQPPVVYRPPVCQPPVVVLPAPRCEPPVVVYRPYEPRRHYSDVGFGLNIRS